MGVTMVDETGLSEVAFLCVEGLELRARWPSFPEVTELWAQVQSAQLDVREGENWSSDAVFKPVRGRALALSRPLAKFHALVVATDGGKDWEMRHLSLSVHPVDICLDTRNVYELAEWALELAQAASAHPSEGQGLSSDNLFGSRPEDTLRCNEGDRADPFCGEPLHVLQPRARDFEASAPVFVRSLLLRRIRLMLSVHFSGRRLGDFRNSERLQALDHVLRHCLPLDFTDATVLLGRQACYMRGGGARDVCLKDEFLPDGFAGLAEGLVADIAGNFLRQLPSILFSQRLLGSPAKLGQELCAVVALAVSAMLTLRVRALLAALLLLFTAVLCSLEGICITVAKAACNAGTGTVPAALRRQPNTGREALRQMVDLSAPWHIRSLLLEWGRLARATRISHSWLTRLRCILLAALRTVSAALSIGLIPLVKLIQALRLTLQHAAWRAWPECETAWGVALPRRACPQQFRSGTSLQFSCASAPGLRFSCAAALGVVAQETEGLWAQDWRLRPLPDGQGVLVALQDGSLFLVSDVGGEPKIAWRAGVAGSQPEVLKNFDRRKGAPPFLLYFRGDAGDLHLGLKSWEAALAAFCFVAECTAEGGDASLYTDGDELGMPPSPRSQSEMAADGRRDLGLTWPISL
uniref:Uncharacterized protein n=1 Tax=Alexandrium monilatum TaxID=311494 RepID=A0A7S4V070_9DINO